MNHIRNTVSFISQISYDIFLITLCGYLLAFALESSRTGLVVRYFNLNNLLLVVVVAGVLAIILPHPEPTSRHPRWYYAAVCSLAGLMGFVVLQTFGMSMWGYIVTACSALLVLSVGIMIQKDS